MEMLQLFLYLIAAYLIFSKPKGEKGEKIAYRITCVVVLSAFFVFFMATKTMILPGVTY